MTSIEIDATSDWHVGNPNEKGEYPTTDEIRESLRSALERNVDAYIVAGDFVDKGNTESARQVADIVHPFIEQGLLVIGIVGNHDFIGDDGKTIAGILAGSGVKMLEGSSHVVTSKTGDKQVTVVGVSGEIGYDYDNWWRTDGWDPVGREKAYRAAEVHRNALQRGLAESQTKDVLVVTHRSIIPDTIGTKARETNFVSPHAQGFANIADSFTPAHRIIFVSGHDHDKPPWQGFLQGQTKGGIEINNVASPVRRRAGLALAKTFVF